MRRSSQTETLLSCTAEYAAMKGTEMNRITITRINPADYYGACYNVQVHTSTNGGKTFYYCGNGRFCETMQDAIEFASRWNPISVTMS